MKKNLIVLLLLIAVSVSFAGDVVISSSSNGLVFGEGDLHLGIGLNWHNYSDNSYYYGDYRDWGTWGDGFGGTFHLDYGAIGGMLSFGGELSLYVDKYTRTISPYRYDFHNVGITPLFRVGFHPFGLPPLKGKISIADKLDPYVLVKLGIEVLAIDKDYYNYYYDYYYGVNNSNYSDGRVDASPIFLATIGARFYFTESFGLWTEIDWDNINGGVTFKF